MIITTYRGTEITYNENNESWDCMVSNKHRSRVNLKDCKDAIDKYLDASDKIKKKFDRFEVIRKDHSYGWEKHTITSVADDAVWVTDTRGNRRKASQYECRSLFLDTPENNATIEVIKQKESEIERIGDELEKLKEQLTFLDVNKFLKEIA